jgi:hypothetical protein
MRARRHRQNGRRDDVRASGGSGQERKEEEDEEAKAILFACQQLLYYVWVVLRATIDHWDQAGPHLSVSDPLDFGGFRRSARARNEPNKSVVCEMGTFSQLHNNMWLCRPSNLSIYLLQSHPNWSILFLWSARGVIYSLGLEMAILNRLF